MHTLLRIRFRRNLHQVCNYTHFTPTFTAAASSEHRARIRTHNNLISIRSQATQSSAPLLALGLGPTRQADRQAEHKC